jgi:hypothetical protein
MPARSLASFILAIAVLSLGACQMPQRSPDTNAVGSSDSARPSLGYLEHRGRRHALRDLLDPAYREASDDPVARNFDVGDRWARRPLLSAHVGGVESEQRLLRVQGEH